MQLVCTTCLYSLNHDLILIYNIKSQYIGTFKVVNGLSSEARATAIKQQLAPLMVRTFYFTVYEKIVPSALTNPLHAPRC